MVEEYIENQRHDTDSEFKIDGDNDEKGIELCSKQDFQSAHRSPRLQAGEYSLFTSSAH